MCLDLRVMKSEKYQSERYSKPSVKVKCDLCDYVGYARGIKTHLRKMHHLQVKEKVTVTQVRNESDGQVSSIVSVSETAIVTSKRTVTEIEWLYTPIPSDGKNTQRRKAIIQDVCRSLGIQPPVAKSIDTIRKESDSWLNSPAGIEYMKKNHSK